MRLGRGCDQYALALCALSVISACGQMEPAEPLESLSAALSTSEVTVLSESGSDFAEVTATRYPTDSGTLETVVTTNPGNRVSTDFDYGCTRDNTNWSSKHLSWTDQGGDVSYGYGTTGANFLYEVMLQADGGGLRFQRSSEPCPTSGSPVWNGCDIADTSLDFPQAVEGRNAVPSNEFWIVYNKGGHIRLGVLTWCSSFFSFDANVACSAITNQNTRFGSAVETLAIGGQQDIHVAFINDTTQKMQHLKFDTSTQTWDCNSLKDIGTYVPPTGVCDGNALDTRPTYNNIANGQTAYNSRNPRLSVTDKGNTNTLIATFATRDNSSCNTVSRTRVFRSTDLGLTWSFVTHSGCNEAVQPDVRGSVVGNSNAVQVHMSWVPTGDTRLRQVKARSTDGGATWSSTFISPARVVTSDVGVGGACYWGDYEALASYHADSSGFFYAWADSQVASPDWVVRGRFQDQ